MYSIWLIVNLSFHFHLSVRMASNHYEHYELPSSCDTWVDSQNDDIHDRLYMNELWGWVMEVWSRNLRQLKNKDSIVLMVGDELTIYLAQVLLTIFGAGKGRYNREDYIISRSLW